MLAHLRRPLAVRVAAPVLVLGLALAWAAPARAARAWAAERTRVTELLTAHDVARVDAALEVASRRAASPEAFAAEVVRTLNVSVIGDVSPAADALLRALFGRMLQAMTLGGGAPVVVVPASPVGAASANSAAVVLAATDVPRPVGGEAPAPGDAPDFRVPREARPQVQALGP